MSVPARATPWLPASCLTARRAAEPFERIVKAWGEEWFSANAWQVLGTWDAVGQPDASDWAVLRDAARLRVKGRPKAMHALALALLDAKEPAKRTDQDVRLMRRVASRALDDLQGRIEDSLGSAPSQSGSYPAESGATYTLLIGVVGGAQLAVECAAADLVQIVRQTFPTKTMTDQLDLRDDAFDEATVTVGASLGQASLSIEQLEQLEVGDILVLDRILDAPAQLTIQETLTDLPFALGEAEGKITLELQELT